ncbi:MAG TPA: cytochrome c oxidase assembly protein [Acidimicrobiales bacterium]|nr:cytochrome c oxidase assembly protein [Acidimicrobiales bacterium]
MHPAAPPYAWDPHLATWAILTSLTVLVVVGHRRLLVRSGRPIRWTRRQIGAFAGACGASVVALTWPLADLAAHWSLTALVVQRLILVLAAAPMLLCGLPYDVIQWLTRPAPVDHLLTRLQRPPAAIATVTVLLVGSMTTWLVQAQSSSALARGLLDVAMVAAGLVLWLPVLGGVPGIPRLKPVVRLAYLVGQAVIPAFLSFALILSVHPLYGAFAHSEAAIGLRPLNDQQIAGFVSKLTMLLVLLSVGAVALARAPLSDDESGQEEPLLWADVERQFERADRRHAKGSPGRAGQPMGQAPSTTGVPVDPDPEAADGSDRSEPSWPGVEPPDNDRPR